MTQVPGPSTPRPDARVVPESAIAPAEPSTAHTAPATTTPALPDELHNALALAIYKAGIPLPAASVVAEAIGANARLLDALVAYRTQNLRAENPNDEVLVEGSWFHPDDLPKILGNYMRGSAEYTREAKEAHLELITARARITELEAKVGRVRAALSGHPRCDVHADDDPVSCGWKRAVADVHHAMEADSVE